MWLRVSAMGPAREESFSRTGAEAEKVAQAAELQNLIRAEAGYQTGRGSVADVRLGRLRGRCQLGEKLVSNLPSGAALVCPPP